MMSPSMKKILIYLLCAILLLSCVIACVLTLRKNDPDPTPSGSTAQSTTGTTGDTGSDATQGTEESTPVPTGTESVEDPTAEIPSKPSGNTGSDEPTTPNPSGGTNPGIGTQTPPNSGSNTGTQTPVTPTTPQAIPVTGVKLNTEKLSMKPGDTKTLTAIISPENADNKAVTWTSSNTDVATVSQDGKVTAHKNGAATITVTTKDGSFVASCRVGVTTEKLTASANYSVFFRNGSAAFDITITASGGTEEYTYSSRIYRNGLLETTKTGNYFIHDVTGTSYRVEITVTDSAGNKVILDPIIIQ